MHNLGQLKSRQFLRRPSIEQIVRASSFHTIDNRRLEKNTKIKTRQFQNQNVIDLANIMQQIQQLKPKTAHRIEQNKNSRNRRVQTLVPGIPKLKSKNNLVSIIDLLKEHRDGKDQPKQLNTLQQRGDQKFSRRIVIQRKSYDRNIELKRKSGEGHECRINFQTIKFPQGVFKTNDLGLAQKETLDLQIEAQKDQIQNEKEKISKNMTEHTFRPKNKITIKNIDKLIFIDSKSRKSPKNTKRAEKDTSKLNQKQKLLVQRQLSENFQELQPMIQPKQKKQIVKEKIPQFIKASLQVYKQQSEFSNFIISTKINQNKTVGHRDDYPPAAYKQQSIQDQPNDLQEQIEEKRDEQNLVGARLNLVRKQKRKSSKIIDYIRQRRQNNTIAVEIAKPIFKQNSRSKPKRNYLEDDFNHKICGWEQTDSANPEPIYFKI